MVAALSCNAIQVYNDFVHAYQKELQASDRALQNFFRRLNGATGTVIVTASYNETGAAAACTAGGGTSGAQSVSAVVPLPTGTSSGAGPAPAATGTATTTRPRRSATSVRWPRCS